jgi:hypothetical protein
VAYGVLEIRTKLSEGILIAVRNEYRIIAEASAAQLLLSDMPVALALRCKDVPAVLFFGSPRSTFRTRVYQCNVCNELCRPLFKRNALKLAQKLCVVVIVNAALARVSLSLDARSSTEMIDHQA